MIDILRPVYAEGSTGGQQTGKRTPVPDDLTADEPATNEYLDPAVKPDLTKIAGSECPKP